MSGRENAEQVPRDVVRKTIRNPRRRYVLYYLDTKDGTVPLDELVSQIAKWEIDAPASEITSQQRKSVYSSLHQTHLPKLEDLGLVTYDVAERTVSGTDLLDRISVYCAANLEPSTRWPKLFLGFAAANGFLVPLVRAGPIPDALSYPLVVISLSILFVLSCWQFYDFHAWVRRFRQRGPDYVVEINEG